MRENVTFAQADQLPEIGAAKKSRSFFSSITKKISLWRLARNLKQAEKEFAAGKGKILHSLDDLVR